jgi:hypothetical protein
MIFSFKNFLRLAILWMPLHLSAINSYNVNYNDVSFLAANRTNQVGNGESIGDVVLYTDIITIGGTSIDCIVHTVSLSNASFALPGSAGSGTNAYDYSATSGGSLSANEDRFFSPLFSFGSGGGFAAFRFEFIEDGSFNAATNSGTAVFLENVAVNSYDIDGNGSSNSNQFNRYEQFSTGQYITGGNIQILYDATSGLTEFKSNTNSNTSNVTDENTRIRLEFDRISSFQIQVGSTGSGAAYFFLDFGSGAAWVNTPTELTPPTLDLNGNDPGIDNDNTVGCQESSSAVLDPTLPVINSPSGDLLEMEFRFPTAQVVDGAEEKLVFKGATSGGTIALNFTHLQAISNVVFMGNTYIVSAKIENDESILAFTPNGGGSLPVSDWEELMDSLTYINESASCSLGDRIFDHRVRDDVAWSPPATYTMSIVSTLPVSLVSFKATCESNSTHLEWQTASEINNDYFSIQKSKDGMLWISIGEVAGFGNSNTLVNYAFTDFESSEKAYYRLMQVDFDGTTDYSRIITRPCSSEEKWKAKVYPNPSYGRLFIEFPGQFTVRLTNSLGQEILKKLGEDIIILENIASGSFILRIEHRGGSQISKVLFQ